MLLNIAELVILCLLADWAMRLLKFPGFIGMLLVGALLGPSVLGLLGPSLLATASDLRQMALIVILLRVGLELSRENLHKVGLNALLLAFLPGLFEALTITLVGPLFLPLTRLECAILGYILAAVSPAVVVPRMIKLNREACGTAKGIPTMVMAGASIDDVVAIVAFGALMAVYSGGEANIAWLLLSVPLSMLTGIAAGLLAGMALYLLFEKFNPRATKRALAVLGVSVLFVHAGYFLEARGIPFAALIAIMAIGFIILEKREHMAHELSAKFGTIWVFAEILLFSSVGAQLRFGAVADVGLAGALLVIVGLLGRSMGTWLSTLGSGLNAQEKLFVVVAYIPKATVQAAIGAVPLASLTSRGLSTLPGELMLATAVMAIVLTAPLGAWAIDWAGPRLLSHDAPETAYLAQEAATESASSAADEL